MKRQIIYKSIVCTFCFVAFIGCSTIMDDDLSTNDGDIVTTRSSLNSDYYYWYNGEKIGISSLKNIFYVSSNDSISLESINLKTKAVSVSSSLKKGKTEEKNVRYWKIIKLNSASAVTDYSLLKSTITNKDVYVAPVFGNSEKSCIATSEFFYVKLKSQDDVHILRNTAQENAVEVIKAIDYMPNWYMLKAPTTSNGLLMSNKFYETGLFDSVDPAFIFNFEANYTPSDPNYSSQWGLEKMKLNNAWDITKGKSEVIVAVIDQGIDQNHKEFANNYSSSSYDLINGSSPSVVRGNHGTHVGGIIGANHNNIQVAGVAPQATLLSISHNLSISPTISSQLASGFGYAVSHGAAVINNSWGDHGGNFAVLHSTILEDAISSAMKNGRNGKGTVVVFASGNMNISTADYPGNFSPDILVVGSINSANNRSNFSSYGTCVDVVAPGSSILSTLPENRVGYMDGTSMAAPHVAGLAALILSLNPDLTRKDVVDLIEKTCQKVGSYSYSTTSNRPNGTWNNEMGYGLCNAFAAVSQAKSSLVEFNNRTISSDYTVTGWTIHSKNITVTNGAKLKMNVGGSISINKPYIINKGAELEILLSHN